jgi:acyl carrier protein
VSGRDLRRIVLEALLEVAPDVDASALDPARTFRSQFDFDSMDQLNFVTALHRRLGIDIPEREYPRLNGLDAAVHYLLGQPAASASAPEAGGQP